MDSEAQLATGAVSQDLTLASATDVMTHRCLIRTPEGFYDIEFGGYTYQTPRAN